MAVKCVAVLGAVLALLVGAGGASARSSREALIRPGIGIGKVNLGMTVPQVKRALGHWQLVNRREERGFGVHYIEYAWNWGTWRVGLLGRRGQERVVRVATIVPPQRTREGIGPGSNTRQLARAYGSRLDCIERDYNVPDPGSWLVLRGPDSRMTAFQLRKDGDLYDPTRRPIVAQVMVQEAWMTPIAGHCPSNWVTWRW